MPERTFSILIVRSVDDLTTSARIRDAALERFPKDGFGGTTLRAVARDAGVSPALVLHHFGSKEGLRKACDEHVVRRFREAKEEGMREENMFSRSFASQAFEVAEPITRYLSWALARGHEAAADLFDDMVAEGIRLTRIAIDRGLVKDSRNLEARVAVQMAMQLGSMVLHPHLTRNLEVDMGTAEGLAAMTPVFLEIFSGLFEPEVLEKLQATYEAEAAAT
jgi:TetR/AcrR family transcriptional regulator, regulator of cefoperazone and chloramphenicol sensitivity